MKKTKSSPYKEAKMATTSCGHFKVQQYFLSDTGVAVEEEENQVDNWLDALASYSKAFWFHKAANKSASIWDCCLFHGQVKDSGQGATSGCMRPAPWSEESVSSYIESNGESFKSSSTCSASVKRTSWVGEVLGVLGLSSSGVNGEAGNLLSKSERPEGVLDSCVGIPE